MSGGLRLFVVLFLLVGASATLCAEQKKSDDLKRLEWKVVQQETAHRVYDDELSKLDLLFAYENLAQAICMPNLLRTFQFAGKPEDKDCLEILEKIKKLGEPSLVKTCIEEGIAAEACKNGYAKQLALPRSSLPSELLRNREGAGDLYDESALPEAFQSARKRYQSSKSIADLRTLMSTIRPGAVKNCENVTVRLVAPSSLPSSEAEYFQDEEGDDTKRVKDLLKELEGSAKKEDGPFGGQPPVPEQDKRVRVRVLSDSCMTYLEAILEAHPLSSFAICQRDGGYSPTCLHTIRQERKYLEGLKNAPSSPSQGKKPAAQGSGFSTF